MGHTVKLEAAIFPGNGGHEGVVGGKLAFIRTEQPQQRSIQRRTVIILFQPMDAAVNQAVADGRAAVGLDLH